jgi:hypothetical protein
MGGLVVVVVLALEEMPDMSIVVLMEFIIVQNKAQAPPFLKILVIQAQVVGGVEETQVGQIILVMLVDVVLLLSKSQYKINLNCCNSYIKQFKDA